MLDRIFVNAKFSVYCVLKPSVLGSPSGKFHVRVRPAEQDRVLTGATHR